MREAELRGLAESLGALTPKSKEPASARVLDAWVNQAQARLGSTAGRLGWLIAATVVTAALQRAVDDDGGPLFLLKGGTMLQYRLPEMSRSTQDVDGLVRGDLDAFVEAVDQCLAEPWGPLSLVRSAVEVIRVPGKVVEPRRFSVFVQHRGVTWRRVPVEVSPDEGGAGSVAERLPGPSLRGFGIPTPDHLVSLSLAYQVAQKVHACTDPHEPPSAVNDRARDLVDLLLLRDLITSAGVPALAEVRAAVEDVFTARAQEAEVTGRRPRLAPARVVAHPHWASSYDAAARSAATPLGLADAAAQVNAWIELIERS